MKFKQLINVALLMAISLHNFAADKALLIGVGKFSDSYIPYLGGIDRDLQMMHRAALQMGFQADKIKILHDDQATYQAIKNLIQEWLIKQSDDQDRILLYYSGHGTQMPDFDGDEKDGLDEVLVTHNTRVAQTANQAHQNIISDDEVGRWLAKIPSQHIMFLVDACNSGSTYKALSIPQSGTLKDGSYANKNAAQVKSFPYQFAFASKPSGPSGTSNSTPSSKSFKREGHERIHHHVLYMSAARDTELAIATSQGSLFTQGMTKAIQVANDNAKTLTYQQWYAAINDFVATKLANDYPQRTPHHPQLSVGHSAKQIHIMPVNPYSDIRQTLDNVVAQAGTGKLRFTTPYSTLYLGEPVRLNISTPYAGWYLNIVQLGVNGEASVLFPNQEHRDNQMQAGRLTIPSAQMSFDILAHKPLGTSRIYAFLTQKKLNFYQSFNQSMPNKRYFARLLPASSKDLLTQKRAQIYAGILDIRVKSE